MTQREILRRCLDTEMDSAIGDSVGYKAMRLTFNPVYDSLFNFDASIDNTLFSAAYRTAENITSDEVIKTVIELIY